MQQCLENGDFKGYMFGYLKLYWSLLKPMLKVSYPIILQMILFSIFAWLYWKIDDNFGITKVIIIMGIITMFYLSRIEGNLRKIKNAVE